MKAAIVDVACQHTEPGKLARSTSWAFLQDFSLYIPLKLQCNEYQTNTSKYTAATYR